jgi:hypothetical protein
VYVQVPVEDIVGIAWEVFQPLLFGLIGAEIQISELDKNTVGENTNTLINTQSVRTHTTYTFIPRSLEIIY